MMVDVIVERKKDKPPKPLSLKMLFIQCSFFILKELINKSKKVSRRRSFFVFLKAKNVGRGSDDAKKEKKRGGLNLTHRRFYVNDSLFLDSRGEKGKRYVNQGNVHQKVLKT